VCGELVASHEQSDVPPGAHPLLRHRHVLSDEIANERVASHRGVGATPHQNELAVRDRVGRTRRPAHMLSAAVAHREERKELRLDDSLPESVHLLRAGDGEQVDVAGSHLVDRAREQVRRASVSASVKHERSLATARRSLLLAKPASGGRAQNPPGAGRRRPPGDLAAPTPVVATTKPREARRRAHPQRTATPPTFRPMPGHDPFARAHATSEHTWDTTAWGTPGIALGTNDFSPGDNPVLTAPGAPTNARPLMTVPVFVTAYVAFVDKLRSYYPNAHIFAMGSPMLVNTGTMTMIEPPGIPGALKLVSTAVTTTVPSCAGDIVMP
jgi:hypothetical protein